MYRDGNLSLKDSLSNYHFTEVGGSCNPTTAGRYFVLLAEPLNQWLVALRGMLKLASMKCINIHMYITVHVASMSFLSRY